MWFKICVIRENMKKFYGAALFHNKHIITFILWGGGSLSSGVQTFVYFL